MQPSTGLVEFYRQGLDFRGLSSIGAFK